jgi:hypothetical protein
VQIVRKLDERGGVVEANERRDEAGGKILFESTVTH